jgi:hypothetical protein
MNALDYYSKHPGVCQRLFFTNYQNENLLSLFK